MICLLENSTTCSSLQITMKQLKLQLLLPRLDVARKCRTQWLAQMFYRNVWIIIMLLIIFTSPPSPHTPLLSPLPHPIHHTLPSTPTTLITTTPIITTPTTRAYWELRRLFKSFNKYQLPAVKRLRCYSTLAYFSTNRNSTNTKALNSADPLCNRDARTS